jgi:hypothetical protein
MTHSLWVFCCDTHNLKPCFVPRGTRELTFSADTCTYAARGKLTQGFKDHTVQVIAYTIAFLHEGSC